MSIEMWTFALVQNENLKTGTKFVASK